MIAEIFPEFYDVHGHKVFDPGTRGRKIGFRPTFPLGRYLTHPLKTQCKDFAELRRFLLTCRYRDMSEGKKRDHWQPPEEFEQTRMGDCADFSLWAWRQVVVMGWPARFVVGKAGKFEGGHAWVVFEKDSKWFLLEPQRRIIGLRMPRISTLRYHPKVSAAWDGHKILYFEHEDLDTDPRLRYLPGLVWEWLSIWTRFWIRVIPRLPVFLARRVVFRR